MEPRSLHILGKHLPSELSSALSQLARGFQIISLKQACDVSLPHLCYFSGKGDPGPNEQGDLVSVVIIQRRVCAPP